ncbi:hypothetical protein ACWJKU_13135 [Methylocaldum sp. MU1018]
MGNGGFENYPAAKPDPVLEWKAGHFINLDPFVEVTGNEVKLTVEPEDLVFIEK